MMQFFRKYVRVIMFVVVLLFVVSCFAGYGMYTRSSDSDGRMKDYAVAVINGEELMRSRLERETIMSIQANAQGQPISEEIIPQIHSSIIDQIALESEFNKEISARGITASKEEIDAEIRNIEQSFPTKEIFMQEMQREGITDAQLRTMTEERIKAVKLLTQVSSAASVDETEKHAFYDTYQNFMFVKPEGFMLNIATLNSKDAADKLKSAIDGGKKWDDAIDEISGDVGYATKYDDPELFPSSEMKDGFAPLLTAQIDVVTNPIEIASDDYLIAIKRSKQEAGTMTYDEVSADIEQQLISQKAQMLQYQFMSELRSRASVQILDPTLFPAPVAPVEPEVKSDDAKSGDVKSGDVKSADAAAEPTSSDK